MISKPWRTVLYAILGVLVAAGIAGVLVLSALGDEPSATVLWVLIGGILAALAVVLTLEFR